MRFGCRYVVVDSHGAAVWEVLIFCRLDRFLVAIEVLGKFLVLVQKLLEKSISDQNLAALVLEEVNWGQKAFKFFNHCMKDESFKKMVTEAWEKIKAEKGDSCNLWYKMRCLKGDIKTLYSSEGVVDSLQIRKLKKELHSLENDGAKDKTRSEGKKSYRKKLYCGHF
ncbi:hypothetical protein PTKIN_Ptkin01aG0105300 [Pterospermum kingtungense]